MKGVLALLLLVLCSCTAAAQPIDLTNVGSNVAVRSELLADNGGVPVVGEVVPEFSYTFSDGSSQRLRALRGRRVLINFWATWCAPCKEEMPALQQIADERADDLVVIGVNKLETPDLIGPFAKELAVRFTLVADQEGRIANRFGAKNIPISYFVHSDGTIGSVHLGVMTYDEIRAAVEALR
jgi:thiol-disulfide isomerase/thioredoxin